MEKRHLSRAYVEAKTTNATTLRRGTPDEKSAATKRNLVSAAYRTSKRIAAPV